MLRTHLFQQLLLTSCAIGTSFAQQYKLDKTYDSSNFLDSFDFETGYDQWSHGSTIYVDQQTATNSGLAKVDQGKIYLGADSTSTFDPSQSNSGRNSVRVQSHDKFNGGLVIGDFDHVPGNACGIWPAFWFLADNGQGYSEIDLIEGTSLETTNEITLYTQTACKLDEQQPASGSDVRTQCINPNDSGPGCGVIAPDSTFGDAVNSNGGAVWALQLEKDALKAWYFKHDSIPQDISSNTPDPSSWGTPVMNFGPGSCNLLEAWTNMNIVINIDFCGDYAGKVWDQSGCPSKTGQNSCAAYVGGSPQAFKEAYFSINSIKTFTQ